MVKRTNNIKCKNNFGEDVDVPSEKFFFRPSAYGFIVHNDKILVMRNKSNSKIWFPGGGVEIHERLEEGLKREVMEETGLEITIKKLALFKENFFYYKPLDEAYHAFLYFYLCQPLTNNLISDESVDDLESEKPRWIKISQIQKNEISDLSIEINNYLQTLIA